MPATTAPEIARWGLIGALKQTIDREFASAFDDVIFQADEEAVRVAQTISPLNAEVIFYASREAIRNAARYARNGNNPRALRLHVKVNVNEGFAIIIEDDGVGFDSVRETNGGSGEGLTLHSTMMAVIGGSLAIESERGRFTRVVLTLPNV